MKTRNVGIVLLLLVNACAPRQTILTVPAVSMTRPSNDVGYVAQRGEKVTAEFCQGDDPIASTDRNVGLIDEAVTKAQRQSGAAYIADVTISQKGTCVMVEGVAMK